MSAIIIFITHPLWIIAIIFFANLIAAIWTVFREKRDIATTWAWLLVLTLLPIIGFTLYLFAGRKISNEQIFHHAGGRNGGLLSCPDPSSFPENPGRRKPLSCLFRFPASENGGS